MPRSRKAAPQSRKMKLEKSSGNVFVDLGFPDDEAASMLLRGDLAIAIRKIIKAKGWTQREAARNMGIAQPRVAEVMKMRLEHFTIDTLVRYLGKLHWMVSVVVEPLDGAT